jgi:PAS domain S-box-containing protein
MKVAGTRGEVTVDIRVLIAEDEVIVANHMARMLEGLGYRTVGIAPTGEECVRRALELSPDVILMDIMLSGSMDGVRAAEKILEQVDIPILYVTAYTDEATLARAKVTEPFGYITKPFGEQDLRAAIAMALYKHRLERRLRESEQRFRLLFEFSPIGVVHYGRDYRIREANERFAMNVREPLIALFQADIREILGKEMGSALAAPLAGKGGFFEGPMRFPDSPDSSWVVFRSAPLLEAGKEISGAIALFEDATERHRVEEELVRLVAIEGFVAECSGEFVGLTAVSLASHFARVLERTGRFVGADRVVLHLFENGSTVVHQVFEWHAEGLASRLDDYRGRDLGAFRWFLQRCGEGEPLCILRTTDIPSDGAEEKSFWLAQGIRSFLAVPLNLHGKALGYLGVMTEREERSWTGENIRLLRLLSQNFVNLFARQRAEEGWEESEDKFHLLVENLNEVIFAVDSRGFFTFVSRGVETLSGYRPEEVLGEHLSRFVHPHDREKVDEIWESATGGLTGAFEFRLLTRDGDVRDLRASIRGVALGTEVAGMTGILVDVTDQKRAEKAFLESEGRYRRLWEDSSDGLVLIDAESGMVIDCNAEFCRLAGRTKEALSSLRIWEIRPVEIREAARQKFLEIRGSGSGGSAELSLERPDGTKVQIDFLSRLLSIGGREVIQSRCRRVGPPARAGKRTRE